MAAGVAGSLSVAPCKAFGFVCFIASQKLLWSNLVDYAISRIPQMDVSQLYICRERARARERERVHICLTVVYM